MGKAIILIPSRLGSTRLPNKPLADIQGKPMIIRVVEQGKKSLISDIYVAAADPDIAIEVEKNGLNAILTNPDHQSGTDRIFEALQKIQGKFEYIVNLQGDLPTIDPQIISDLLKFIENSDYDIVTAVAKIIVEEEKASPNVVKAVVSWKNANTGTALYFTRATVPYGAEELFHHIGIYIYRRAALENFISMPISLLEKTEKLEQLRALENAMKIGVLKVDTIPLGVDTMEDLEKARNMFKNGLVR
ncbi:MAG TPA: 3-deoxy-manno-octulosonate cytidylyltransferase [Alphaproteobacteria bacterium]|nr:3-deoxy-manno-octulosonate cytidylyltransferase [Alphaproteobacteria bacterium]